MGQFTTQHSISLQTCKNQKNPLRGGHISTESNLFIKCRCFPWQKQKAQVFCSKVLLYFTRSAGHSGRAEGTRAGGEKKPSPLFFFWFAERRKTHLLFTLKTFYFLLKKLNKIAVIKTAVYKTNIFYITTATTT